MRSPLVALVLAPLITLAAACGDDGVASPSATGETAPAVASTAVPPAATDAPSTVAVTDPPTTDAPTTEAAPDVPDTLNTKGADGPYDAARDPRADIEVAKEIAAANGKLVLLDFGANWCPDCLVLDELYADPAVAALLADHYVLVTIDVGEFDRNMDLSAEYNDAAAVGIPALVVMQPDGTILGDTHNGEFASASTFGPDDVTEYLITFVS